MEVHIKVHVLKYNNSARLHDATRFLSIFYLSWHSALLCVNKCLDNFVFNWKTFWLQLKKWFKIRSSAEYLEFPFFRFRACTTYYYVRPYPWNHLRTIYLWKHKCSIRSNFERTSSTSLWGNFTIRDFIQNSLFEWIRPGSVSSSATILDMNSQFHSKMYFHNDFYMKDMKKYRYIYLEKYYAGSHLVSVL